MLIQRNSQVSTVSVFAVFSAEAVDNVRGVTIVRAVDKKQDISLLCMWPDRG